MPSQESHCLGIRVHVSSHMAIPMPALAWSFRGWRHAHHGSGVMSDLFFFLFFFCTRSFSVSLLQLR